MRKVDKKTPQLFIFVIAFFALLPVLIWLNNLFVSQNPESQAFSSYWLSSRALMLDGISPYEASVANRISTREIGWEGFPPSAPVINYPLYGVLLLWPFALISDFTVARTAWMTALQGALVITVIFCMRTVNWRSNPWITGLFFAFALTWFHSLYPILEGSMLVWVGMLLSLAFAALVKGLDEVVGFLLALSTIQPLAVILVVLLILLWAVLQQRWRLLVWFGGSMVLLIFSSMLFVPDWPIQYAGHLSSILTSSSSGNPIAIFSTWWPGVGRQVGIGLMGFSIFVLGVEWWLAMRRTEWSWILWTACLTLALGLWAGLPVKPDSLFLLLIPITLVFKVWDERWKKTGRLAMGLMIIFLWLVPWLIYLNGAGAMIVQPVPAVLFLLSPLSCVFGLYWIRWWAVRPKKMLLDELRSMD
jgi:hypothetical protein